MNVYLTLATRYGLNILGLLGGSVALYLGSSIFIPLVISVLLAAMLQPLAIAVIGALCISVLLSLIATPTVYLLLRDRQLDMAEHGLFPGRTELAESELM